MDKQEYLDLLNSKPWEIIENIYGEKTLQKPTYITKLDINSEDWIQFTVDNFELAQQKAEQERPHYTELANLIARQNNKLGRNAGNSFELNFGMNGNTNETLVTLLGNENINRLGIKQEGILVRLIVNTPGHGASWHHDSADSYLTKFPECEGKIEELVRFWFSVVPWYNGHVFQVGSSMLYGWQAGDAWQIPWKVPHASSNFGYNLKYTVSLTGRLK